VEHLEFYNLKEQPFSTAYNKYFFDNSQHAQALLRLKYAIDGMKGLAVVVGSLGTGKTTLLEEFLMNWTKTIMRQQCLWCCTQVHQQTGF